MKIVGIDLGSYIIKVVEVNSTSKGFQLVQYFTHQISLKPNTDAHFEIIEFLRSTTSKYDPLNTKFIVGLRQDKISIRTKTFPFMDRNKIGKTLPLELEEDIPFNIDNAVFDFKFQKITPPTSEVLAFAAKKEEVEKTIQLLKEGGVQIDILSTEGSAFANLFENWNAPLSVPKNFTAKTEPVPEETQIVTQRQFNLILNIGHSQTLVMVLENNKLISVRNILWGGRYVGELIAKKYNLPPSEAHKELELKGFILTKKQEISPESKAFSDLISRAIRDLIREVQISILEIKAEGNADILKIDLTGGMSLIQGIGPYMTQLLEIPCNKLNVLDQFSQVYFEKNDAIDAQLGVSVGLAIEGLKKPRNPSINFLKNEYAKKNHRFKNFWGKWGSSVQVSFALLVVFYVWSYLRVDFTTAMSEEAVSNLKAMAKKTIGLSTRSSNEKNIKKYISENKKTISDMKTAALYYQMNSSMEILKKVTEHLPNKNQVKLDLKYFNVDEQQVTLEGYVQSSLEKELLKESLRSMAIDDKVQSGNATLPTKPQKVSFLFVLNVDRGITREK